MARQFKPVRFFLDGVGRIRGLRRDGVLHPPRAAHGQTSEERSAYFLGEKTDEEAAAGSQLSTAADLNEMAQKRFKTEGTGEPMAWKGALETGYTDGFNKTRKP